MATFYSTIIGLNSETYIVLTFILFLKECKKNIDLMKERVSKLTYPTLQHCLRMLYTMNGNSKH